MYLDGLENAILDGFHHGSDRVMTIVRNWLADRGFKEDDFSNPVFIDKALLDILRSQDVDKEREQAFNEGVDHVLEQLRIINPYGDRNGFLDD